MGSTRHQTLLLSTLALLGFHTAVAAHASNIVPSAHRGIQHRHRPIHSTHTHICTTCTVTSTEHSSRTAAYSADLPALYDSTNMLAIHLHTTHPHSSMKDSERQQGVLAVECM